MRNRYGIEVVEPKTPYYLWPMAIVAGLVIAWAIDQVIRPKEI